MSSTYVRWTDKRAKWDSFFKMLGRRLDGNSIEIGFTEETGAAQYEKGLTVAEVAAINEFGTLDGHIPARPFLRQTLEDRDNFRKEIREAIRSIAWGATPEEALEYVGEQAVAAVRETIDKYSSPPNAASTIREKGENNPLVRTRMLQGAIAYRLKRRLK